MYDKLFLFGAAMGTLVVVMLLPLLSRGCKNNQCWKEERRAVVVCAPRLSLSPPLDATATATATAFVTLVIAAVTVVVAIIHVAVAIAATISSAAA